MKKDPMGKFCAPHAHDIVRWERGTDWSLWHQGK